MKHYLSETFERFRTNYVLPPILTGTERPRGYYFTKGRDLPPKRSFPFSQRKQENQGYRGTCTFHQFIEIVENKVFWETGKWYKFPDSQLYKGWDIAKSRGLASESKGAHINTPLIVFNEDTTILLVNTVSDEKLTVRVKDWFPVGNKNDENFVEQIKREICFGGGCLSGLDNLYSKLDYFSASKYPHIVKKQTNAKRIAHATCLSEFDEQAYSGLIKSSGTWGENFGENGVVYFQEEDLKKLFVPIGFTLEYL